MNIRTKKWLKGIGIALLTPWVLLVVISILLYVPFIQDPIKDRLTSYASNVSGLHISIDRLRLSFPLDLAVDGIKIVSPSDTLVEANKLVVDVGILKLFSGQFRIDGILLSKAKLNSSNLINGMLCKGRVGELSLTSDKIDILRQEASISNILLKESDLSIALRDTPPTPPKKPSKPFNWKITIHKVQLRELGVEFLPSADTIRVSTYINNAVLGGGELDLKHKLYRLAHLSIVKASFDYDVRKKVPLKGFDPSHLALRDISISMESLMNRGKVCRAELQSCSFIERSGLAIKSLKGKVITDGQSIKLPMMQLITPYSMISLSATTDLSILKNVNLGRASSSFVARIGKQDAALFIKTLPKKFWQSCPSKPFTLRLSMQGNARQSKLSVCQADLSGVASFKALGDATHLTDSLRRSVNVTYYLETKSLGCITTLFSDFTRARVRIPLNMKLDGKVMMNGKTAIVKGLFKEQEGIIRMLAQYDGQSKHIAVETDICDLQVNHFLPKDSVYSLSASFYADAKGTDLFAKQTELNARFDLLKLQVGKTLLSGFSVGANIKNKRALIELNSSNEYLQMDAVLKAPLRKELVEGDLSMNVRKADLYKMRLISKPLTVPVAFTLNASVRKDKTSLQVRSGDLHLSFMSATSLKSLVKEATLFSNVLMKQIKQKKFNQGVLRKSLPSSNITLSAGEKNMLSELLLQSKVHFQNISLDISSSRTKGLNGRMSFNSLGVDSLLFDTVSVILKQDSAALRFRAKFNHLAKNNHVAFQAYVNGLLGNNNASILMKYVDTKGEIGTNLGLSVRQEKEGYSFHLFPEQPILFFRTFRLNKDNRIYVGKDNRCVGNLDLQDKDGAGVFIHSANTMANQQDMIAEFRNINLKEVVNSFPYLPNMAGIFSAKVEYIQMSENYKVLADAVLRQFKYDNQDLGNLHLAATYLPQSSTEHQLSINLMHNKREVLTAEGVYRTANQGSMDVHGQLKNFPLGILNPFIPQKAQLTGALNGEIVVQGTTQVPKINGQIWADTTSVYLAQAGVRVRLDKKAIKVVDNRLLFDNYQLFAAGKSPFVIGGEVDFTEMKNIKVNLKWNATNFQLLEASRTKESLVYGKLFANVNATLRGPVDALVLRGNIRLLNNTDVTYVLKDSPLEVQDRLAELVTFVDFNDTLQVAKERAKPLSLGGLDMLVQIQIDPSVKLKADLSPDRSSRVELEGGGNLSLQYTPQGDLLLYGKYTFTGGLFKYTLPIIPLKTFAIENGSYVEWTGSISEPILGFKASEKLRASVAEDNKNSRQVVFDVSVSLQNSLKNLALVFDLAAPEDMDLQNKLVAMTQEERSKLAITLLATGMYMPTGANVSGAGGINMGNALSNFIQSEVSAIGGKSLEKIDFSFGMDSYDSKGLEGTGKRTDYSYSIAQRFYNDRIRVVIGGKVSTGETADKDQSFIDNISIEYSLDASRSRYIKLFHNKSYDSFLEGEITKTGVGIVLHKKMRRLGDLFIFRKKKESK